MPQSLPIDRREAALAYFGLVRAYWRLAEAARRGSCDDDARRSIEEDALRAIEEAAKGTGLDEGVAARALQALQRVFDRAQTDTP